ncbi:unnamed protein product, partial [Notodromas monacha]
MSTAELVEQLLKSATIQDVDSEIPPLEDFSHELASLKSKKAKQPEEQLIEVKARKASKAPIILDRAQQKAALQPFARPPNQTEQQHMQAMALASGLTDKLLDQVKQDPELYSLLEDPEFSNVLLQFQFTPETAIKRYQNDERI